MEPPTQLETEFVEFTQMSRALLIVCDRSDRSPSTPGTGHLWRPLTLMGNCSCPAHHQEHTTEGLVWRGGRDLLFFPVIVDNMPRHDAFEAEVQEKV